MNKKFLSAVCAATLLTGTFMSSMPAFADGIDGPPTEKMLLTAKAPDSAVKTTEPTTAELEKIIKIVKPQLDVPEDYTEFNWDFYAGSAYNVPSWSLSWEKYENGYGQVAVQCDTEGHITSYDFYNDESYTRGFPKYQVSELEQTAKDIVKKFAPDAHLEFKLSEGSYGIYDKNYTYSFVRKENGLELADNYATVGINNMTGAVTNVYIVYDRDAKVTDSTAGITVDDAKKKLGEKQKLELRYSLSYSEDETGKPVKKAVLIYAPTEYYLSADAKTGEIYTTKEEWAEGLASEYGDRAAGNMNGAAMKSMVTEDAAVAEAEEAYDYSLNEKELAQLDVLEGLIKKDEAIKKITDNGCFYVDETLTIADASLRKSYGDTYYRNDNKEDFKYIWDINFRSNEAQKYNGYMYANGTVDAVTGEVLSYHSNLRSYWFYEDNELPVPEKKYTEEQCREIAEKYLKGANTEKFANMKFTDRYETNVILYENKEDGISVPHYGAYSFQYVRVNDGVEFSYDNASVTVDAITGKISHYSFIWTNDIEFEPVSKAIGANKAFEKYCEYAGLGLRYELFTKYGYSDKAIEGADDYIASAEYYTRDVTCRLVYAWDNTYIYVGALSGKRVSFNGDEYPEYYTGEFTDIEGHWAYDYITMLSNIGAVEKSEKFRPDDDITKEEFEEIASHCGFYSDMGVTETLYDGKFTRLEAVKTVINGLGYSKIASLTGIYRTEFSDNPEIAEEDIGYLAIAYGLGIISGDAGTKTFRPNEILSRAEAAKLIVETVKFNFS